MTSARNATLIRICQNVRFSGEQRVCEALASGIPTVLTALRRVHMTPPAFFDQGIRFTVSVPNHALLGSNDLDWLHRLETRVDGLTDIQRHALVMMRGGEEFTNRSFRDRFPMDSRDARRELLGLVERKLAVADGERGGRTYRIVDGLEDPDSRATDPTQQVLAHLQGQPREVAELAELTGLNARQVRYVLRKLRESGRATMLRGGPGQRTTYGAIGGDRLFER